MYLPDTSYEDVLPSRADIMNYPSTRDYNAHVRPEVYNGHARPEAYNGHASGSSHPYSQEQHQEHRQERVSSQERASSREHAFGSSRPARAFGTHRRSVRVVTGVTWKDVMLQYIEENDNVYYWKTELGRAMAERLTHIALDNLDEFVRDARASMKPATYLLHVELLIGDRRPDMTKLFVSVTTNMTIRAQHVLLTHILDMNTYETLMDMWSNGEAELFIGAVISAFGYVVADANIDAASRLALYARGTTPIGRYASGTTPDETVQKRAMRGRQVRSLSTGTAPRSTLPQTRRGRPRKLRSHKYDMHVAVLFSLLTIQKGDGMKELNDYLDMLRVITRERRVALKLLVKVAIHIIQCDSSLISYGSCGTYVTLFLSITRECDIDPVDESLWDDNDAYFVRAALARLDNV